MKHFDGNMVLLPKTKSPEESHEQRPLLPEESHEQRPLLPEESHEQRPLLPGESHEQRPLLPKTRGRVPREQSFLWKRLSDLLVFQFVGSLK